MKLANQLSHSCYHDSLFKLFYFLKFILYTYNWYDIVNFVVTPKHLTIFILKTYDFYEKIANINVVFCKSNY